MKNNRAFTLIEVMVVLSILALIAILAYNFFGSTMKEAVVKQAMTSVNKDLNMLSAATELYYQKTGTKLPNNSTGTELVTAGIIKAIPAPPAIFNASDGAYKFQSNYDCMGTTAMQTACANDEDVWYLRNFTDLSLCQAYNEQMNLPWAGTYPVWSYDRDNGELSNYPNEGLSWCVMWSASGKIMLIHEQNL